MKHFRGFGAAALAAALLSGTAAQALTADQVWTSIKDQMAGFGQTVTVGAQSRNGATLAITSVSTAFQRRTAKAVITIPEIDLAEGADGSVTLTLPKPVQIDVTGDSPKGGTITVALGMSPEGLQSVVSGTEGDLSYATTAQAITLSLDKMVADGKPVEASGKVVMSGIASTAHVTGTDPETVDSSGSVASIKGAFDFSAPEGTNKAQVGFDVASLTSTAKVTLPKGVDMQDMAAAVAAGYAATTDIQYGQSTVDFSSDAKQGVTQAKGAVASGHLHVVLDKGQMSYAGGSKDARLNLASGAMPFPIELTEKESEFNLRYPVSKSDASQPFSLLLRVIGLELNQQIWAMVDPQGGLPHDPATLILDLAGTGKLGFDLLDPNAKDHMPEMPGELDTLNLNKLQLTALGADVSGKGALTFDNSPGQMPRPVGEVDLTLKGVYGLLDKLIEMGLLPQDQAMGAKLTIGMFTTPKGDDELSSKIEFKKDGAILANGHRVQ